MHVGPRMITTQCSLLECPGSVHPGGRFVDPLHRSDTADHKNDRVGGHVSPSVRISRSNLARRLTSPSKRCEIAAYAGYLFELFLAGFELMSSGHSSG